jgi:hypothetical protein
MAPLYALQRLAAALALAGILVLTGCTDQMLTETPDASESTEIRTSNSWQLPPADLTETDSTATDSMNLEDDSDWEGSTQRIIQRY